MGKYASSIVTAYPNHYYELSGSNVTKYYFFNGQRVAMRKNAVLSYLHADHLGSTLLATDASGAVVDNNQPRYYAYGRERIADIEALPTDHTFTGQKLDANGLYYFNARYSFTQWAQSAIPNSAPSSALILSCLKCCITEFALQT